VPTKKGTTAPNDIPEDERDYFLSAGTRRSANLVPRDVASRANALRSTTPRRGPLHNGVYLDLRDAIARSASA
jgi:succinate dehydrogenase / fumarate reductase flavoprotein subunit